MMQAETPGQGRFALAVLLAMVIEAALVFGLVHLPAPAPPPPVVPPETVQIHAVTLPAPAPPAPPPPVLAPPAPPPPVAAPPPPPPPPVPQPAPEPPPPPPVTAAPKLPEPPPPPRRAPQHPRHVTHALPPAPPVTMAETIPNEAPPQMAAAAPAPSAAATASALDIYAVGLRSRVQADLVVPAGVRALGITGRTLLDIRLAPDGQLLGVRVVTSSGATEIDDTALASVQRTRFPAFTANMPQHPLAFSLSVRIGD